MSLLLICGGGFLLATEKDDWDYPLGPLGGRGCLQLGSNSLRVSELDEGGAGELGGLRVNDYLFGAFGEPFAQSIKDTWNFYVGPMKGLWPDPGKLEESKM